MASLVFRTGFPGPCPHARPGADRHRGVSAPAACAQAGLFIRLLLAAARANRAHFAKVPRTPNSDDARGWPACPRSHRSAPSSAPTTIRTPASPSRLLFPPSMTSRTASMGFSYRRFALTTTTRSRTRTCSRSVRSFLHLAFCRPSRARADLLSTFPSQSMESGPARVTAAPSRLRLASSPPTQVRPTLSLAAALPLPDSSHGRTQNSASRRGSRRLSTGSSSAAWPPTLAALSFGMCARSPSSSCRRSKLTLSDGAARRLWHSERHRKLRSLLRRLAHRPRRQDGPDRPSLSARSRRPDAASSRCVLASTSSSPLYIPDSPTACSARSRRHLLLHLAGILRPRRP